MADDYSIKKLDSTSGIFFEFHGEAHYYNNEQEVITYLNIDVQSQKIKIVADLCAKTKSTVDRFLHSHDVDLDHHLVLLKQFSKEIDLIRSRAEHLHQLLGHYVSNKFKRGWFDFVGIAAKELFGIMDSKDAEYIDLKLNEFDNSEHILASTIKEQSHVVRSTILNFNNTVASIKQLESQFTKNIQKMIKSINKNAEAAQIIDFQLTVDEHFIQFAHLINNIKLEYDALINAVLFASKGILHPSILSPAQLFDYLKSIAHSIPPGLQLPLPSNSKNAHLLLKIIDLIVYFYNSRLVFKIKIPLFPVQPFSIYKLNPLPFKLVNNTYVFIKPSQNYIVVRKDKQQYLMIHENELNNCKVFYRKFLCKQNQPFYDITYNGNCEAKIFALHEINVLEECDVRLSRIVKGVWHRLDKKNSWIFVVQSKKSMTISCNNVEYAKDILIENSGILSVSENCTAYVDNTMLQPFRNYESSIEKDFSPPFDACEAICNDDNIRKLNVSFVNFEHINNPNIMNLDELNLANIKLKDMEYFADHVLRQTKNSKTTTTLTYIVYGSLACVAIYILFGFWRKVSCGRSCLNTCHRIIIRNNINHQPPSQPYPQIQNRQEQVTIRNQPSSPNIELQEVSYATEKQPNSESNPVRRPSRWFT